MILINSADYVVPELQIEYGKIPPCMLPLGNKRLFQYQLETVFEFLGDNEKIYISLPADYSLNDFDRKLLEKYHVSVVPVPSEFTLGQSLLYVLNVVPGIKDCLYMLHGDTLISPVNPAVDIIGTGSTRDNYDWQLESRNDSNEVVWCGYFSFSNVQLLIQSLALARADFVDALKSYRTSHGLDLVEVQAWYDLGHLNTYFKSRAEITTQRAFNELYISNGTVKKTGTPPRKITAEASWFQNIPTKLKKFTPQLITSFHDSVSSHYELEYLPLPPLNEVYVYGLNPPFFWAGIFNSLNSFMESMQADMDVINQTTVQSDFIDLVKKKSLTRLDQYASESQISLTEIYSYNGCALNSLVEIVKHCSELTLADDCHPAIIHGDLCFSNILYDSRSSSLKMLDPRGMNLDGIATIYGDQRYDLAKLGHSVIGMYDFIMSGRYNLVESAPRDLLIEFGEDSRVHSIQQLFLKTEFIPGYVTSKILPLVILLFLSMLPLHNDRPDRQHAMLANALRLYYLLREDAL
ncbi:hypothetical protein FBG13_12230 [Cobetia marina]|uniref:hypothetical protein n=1 Tax=Cobetia marina TaxID=28258 RepID=UPI0010AE70BA|nr:hypothetical protein [Cobetia marina]TKD61470.1 hypothetical protein FBG13_12230 [Cobetia marina]